MKYQGEKARIARRIVAEMVKGAPDATRWVEPFVGGAWVLEAADASNQFTSLHAGDAMEDVVLLYQAVAAGWDPPRAISRELYLSLKRAEPSALRALAGFGSAYGGTFMTGYCGDSLNGTRTNAEIAADHLVRRRDLFRRTDLRHTSYETWEGVVDETTLLYCDPPYSGTYPYPGNKEPFDSARFWKWAVSMADRGASVFVSEYAAPEEAVTREVWSRTARRTVAQRANTEATERLLRVLPSA